MRSFKLSLAIATAAMAAAVAPAHASHTITFTAPAPDGSFSGAFQNLALGAGAFSDVYNFDVANPGILNATLSSIFQAALNNNVDFTSATLNGQEFTVGSTGDVEFRFLSGLNVAAGPQVLIISGVSGGNGSYAGTIAYSQLLNGVPEPAAWATLLTGFALVGTSMRRKRTTKLPRVSA